MFIKYKQTFINQSTISLTHNLGTEYLTILLIVGNERRMELISSIEPNPIDPTNISDVTLTGITSGYFLVFYAEHTHTGISSNTQASHSLSITKPSDITQLTGADTALSEPTLMVVDSTRGNKSLSIETSQFVYGRKSVNTNIYLKPSSGFGSNSGFIMPYNGTIIRASLFTVDNKNQSRSFSIYVGAVEHTGVLATTGLGTQTTSNTALNIDVVAGDNVRLRGRGPGTKIKEVTATIWIKWRV